jgi:hypothetical protein
MTTIVLLQKRYGRRSTGLEANRAKMELLWIPALNKRQ